jgi:hypothetical protein
MREKTEKKRLSILRCLKASRYPLSSSKITEQLNTQGLDVSERTVRFYLLELDREGLTENLGKRGRRITDRGHKETAAARAYEKVGYLAARIDQMTYNMSFDLATQRGTVVVNASLVHHEQLRRACPLIRRVFDAGYAMGRLLKLVAPGERIGEVIVPDDCVGIGTVCSVTLNGVLLSQGIPTHNRFGGLLEMQGHQPTRFVELIHYEGTTLDPLEVFIASGMTDYTGATATGNGRIGASFREMPAESRDRVIMLKGELEKVGLGAILTVGWPGQSLMEIPVGEGRLGVVVIGGLNPVAILEEQGIHVHSRALASLTEFETLFDYQELDDRVQAFL